MCAAAYLLPGTGPLLQYLREHGVRPEPIALEISGEPNEAGARAVVPFAADSPWPRGWAFSLRDMSFYAGGHRLCADIADECGSVGVGTPPLLGADGAPLGNVFFTCSEQATLTAAVRDTLELVDTFDGGGGKHVTSRPFNSFVRNTLARPDCPFTRIGKPGKDDVEIDTNALVQSFLAEHPPPAAKILPILKTSSWTLNHDARFFEAMVAPFNYETMRRYVSPLTRPELSAQMRNV